MNHFNNFCNNVCLSKCYPHGSNNIIQTIFTDIFATTYVKSGYVTLVNMRKHPNIKKCMICSNFIETDLFTICKYCANKCVGFNIELKFAIKYDVNSDVNGPYKLYFRYDLVNLFD